MFLNVHPPIEYSTHYVHLAAKHGVKIVHRTKEFANMAPKLKKPKKTRKVSEPLHGHFSTKNHVYGQLQGAATHSHYEALDKHSMGGKTPVIWQCLPFGGVLLLFKLKPHGTSSTRILCNMFYKLFVGFIFGSVSVQTAGRTLFLVLLL